MPLSRFEKLDEPRRKSILAAAAEEFGTRGYEAASYNRIIERAGISKGAMYYYFADKDDLYRTVLETALLLWFGNLGVGFEADDAESFWRACEGIYQRCLRFMLDDPQSAALCLSVARARERSEGHPALAELADRMMQWTSELVRKGQSVGAVRTDLPPELLVRVGLSLMDAGDRWLASRWNEIEKDQVDEIAAMMVALFRRVGEPEGKSDDDRRK